MAEDGPAMIDRQPWTECALGRSRDCGFRPDENANQRLRTSSELLMAFPANNVVPPSSRKKTRRWRE